MIVLAHYHLQMKWHEVAFHECLPVSHSVRELGKITCINGGFHKLANIGITGFTT